MKSNWIFIIPIFFMSCASGPKMNPCVYSSKDTGSYCSDSSGKEKKFLPAAMMENFMCLSPGDAETAWKACGNFSAIIWTCVYSAKDNAAYCSDSKGNKRAMSNEELENYVCLSEIDTKAVMEHCAQ